MFVKRLTLEVMTREGVVDELNVVVGAVTEGFCIIGIAVCTEQPIGVTVVAVPDKVNAGIAVFLAADPTFSEDKEVCV